MSVNNNRISVVQGGAASAAIVVKKPATVNTLGSIGDVSLTGIQDNYTLVYNSTTNKWEAAPAAATPVSIDGGTY